MSSLFSFGSKTPNSSSASSLRSNRSGKGKDGKEVPPETSEVFMTPPEGLKPTKKWNYDEAQLKQIEELQKYTSTLTLPSDDAYYPWEQRFLNDPGTHPRYMRAAKWKMDDAKRRIKGTMEWRREFKPELISPEDVGIEAETGKIIISGFDNDARPIIYMRPGRENTKTSPRQVRHLIFCLERGLDLMPAGQEQYCIIIDYKSATAQSNPSISTGLQVLSILQNHYVERLGRGLIVNTSWIVNIFFQGISPFMDPITRDKIRSNPDLLELVPVDQLDWEFGGNYHLKFDYASYWETLTKFCHLAPDGTRVDDQGKPWIPPAGNGIQAAVDGIVPSKDAVATGEVVHDPEAAAAGAPASSKAEEPRTESEKIASDHRADSPATVRDGAEGKELEGIENGVAGVTLNGDAPRTATSPPPNVRTKSGAPAGDVAFDHPPTEEEKEEIRRSLDVRA